MVCDTRIMKWMRLKKKTDEGSEKAIVDKATVNRQANKARLPPIRSATIPENNLPTIEPTAPQANISPS